MQELISWGAVMEAVVVDGAAAESALASEASLSSALGPYHAPPDCQRFAIAREPKASFPKPDGFLTPAYANDIQHTYSDY